MQLSKLLLLLYYKLKVQFTTIALVPNITVMQAYLQVKDTTSMDCFQPMHRAPCSV